MERRKDEIDFLRENAEYFLEVDLLKAPERLMLSFNLLKYYIVLLRGFKEGLNSASLNQQYPGLKWNEFLNSKQFKELAKETSDDLSQN